MVGILSPSLTGTTDIHVIPVSNFLCLSCFKCFKICLCLLSHRSQNVDFVVTVISQPDEGKQEDKVKMSEDNNQTNCNSEAADSKEDDSDEKLEDKKEQFKKETSGGDGWFSSWNMSDFAKKVQDKVRDSRVSRLYVECLGYV